MGSVLNSYKRWRGGLARRGAMRRHQETKGKSDLPGEVSQAAVAAFNDDRRHRRVLDWNRLKHDYVLRRVVYKHPAQ